MDYRSAHLSNRSRPPAPAFILNETIQLWSPLGRRDYRAIQLSIRRPASSTTSINSLDLARVRRPTDIAFQQTHDIPSSGWGLLLNGDQLMYLGCSISNLLPVAKTTSITISRSIYYSLVVYHLTLQHTFISQAIRLVGTVQ
jgi:hypothetical protein